MRTITSSFEVHASLTAVWAFHNDLNGLAKIMPGPLQVLAWDAPLRLDSRLHLRLGFAWLGVAWQLRVAEHVPMQRFVDVQVRGPFKSWRHEHNFFQASPDGPVQVNDRITFALPLGLLTEPVVAALLPLTFAHRRRKTRALLGQGTR